MMERWRAIAECELGDAFAACRVAEFTVAETRDPQPSKPAPQPPSRAHAAAGTAHAPDQPTHTPPTAAG